MLLLICGRCRRPGGRAESVTSSDRAIVVIPRSYRGSQRLSMLLSPIPRFLRTIPHIRCNVCLEAQVVGSTSMTEGRCARW
jgi:hypothetical protein